MDAVGSERGMSCQFNIATGQVGNSKFSGIELPQFEESKTRGLRGRSRVDGVFASGNPVASGIVGFANIVFLDSPPLAGRASRAAVSFVEIGSFRVTSVTRPQNTANPSILGGS